MSDIEKKRAFVYDMYPGKGWHAKVKKMSDAQIVAIYLKHQSEPQPQHEEKPDDDSDTIPF
jgi:hypothetical protein